MLNLGCFLLLFFLRYDSLRLYLLWYLTKLCFKAYKISYWKENAWQLKSGITWHLSGSIGVFGHHLGQLFVLLCCTFRDSAVRYYNPQILFQRSRIKGRSLLGPIFTSWKHKSMILKENTVWAVSYCIFCTRADKVQKYLEHLKSLGLM